MRLTPIILRECARECRRAVQSEADFAVRRRLAGEALALAQFAEQLERAHCFVTVESIERYKKMLAGVLDDAQRCTIEELLKQEQAKGAT